MAENQHTAFRGLFDMFAEMNRMREHWTDADQGGDRGPSAWVPAVDIYASGDDLVVRCELAGIPKSDVEVSLSDGQLWISGERTDPPEDPTYYVRERRYGPFRRIITLPGSVEGHHISATVEDGLLEVVVAGACRARHEQIEIGGADNGDVNVDVKR
jgi:HSP20 family protein